VHLGHELRGLVTNPVFRDGKIYIAGFYKSIWTLQYEMNLVRLSVGRSSDGSSIWAQKEVDHKVTRSLSHGWPALEVNKENNLVVSFIRAGLRPTDYSPADARYSVWYAGESELRDSAPLKCHQGEPTSAPPEPDVDLTGVALDPSDNQTVWMSQAHWDNGHYRVVVGAVKP
jgi:hypothetical protein